MEKEHNPLISIIIPVYNGSNYLEEAIESALNQSYKNIEVIVINDGSTDNGLTEKIALKYKEHIKYLCKPNGGVSSALNLGIRNMQGTYFSWLSHDDKYDPSKIEDQVNKLKSFSNKNCIILSQSIQIDKNSKTLTGKKLDNSFKEDKCFSSPEALKAILKGRTFNGCALLIPKQAFNDAGLFDERLRYTQDAMMWYKIFLAGYGLCVISKVGVMSRVHESQLTQTGRKLYKENCERMAKELIPIFSEISTHDYNYFYYFALRHAKYNNRPIVKTCLSYKKLSATKCITIKCMQLYGGIRPFIRRMYHRVFNKMKTQ